MGESRDSAKNAGHFPVQALLEVHFSAQDVHFRKNNEIHH